MEGLQIKMEQGYLQVHPTDNVLVALTNLSKGTVIAWEGEEFSLPQDVPAKHKFSVAPMSDGDGIYMYGVLVGRLQDDIPSGGLITRINTEHATEKAVVSEKRNCRPWQAPDISQFADRTFNGYHRSDGKVGTANHWIVVPLVFCENRNIEILKQALTTALGYSKIDPYTDKAMQLVEMFSSGAGEDLILKTDLKGSLNSEESPDDSRLFRNIDGIKFLTHNQGCCTSRDDSNTLVGLIANYITHPNVGGATVLSLGCQNAQMYMLETAIKQRDPHFNKPLVMLEQQKEGTEKQLMEEALKQTFAGMIKANKATRKPAPISKLVVGLECGGSDGFSGISANPAIGYASDILVACGGASILSEFPELCGVEQELADRCVRKDSAEKFLHLMETYNQRAEEHGTGFYANPTEGNIRDGLITDAIKSAGAARKGGTSPVTDVLDYPEPLTRPGLNLYCTPGSDIESVTAIVGAGAQVVLFTTGLGTPTGNPIAQTIKISSNSKLAKKMWDIIDIDCGGIIDRGKTIQRQGEEILNDLIEVASGNKMPNAVRLQQDDFMPWKRGISI